MARKKQSDIIETYAFQTSQMACLLNGGVVITTKIFWISRDAGYVLSATQETAVLIQTDKNQTNFSKCPLMNSFYLPGQKENVIKYQGGQRDRVPGLQSVVLLIVNVM